MLKYRLEISDISIYDIVEKRFREVLKDGKIMMFGAGMGGVNTCLFLDEHIGDSKYLVSCFIDNNPLKKGTFVHGIKVLSAEEALKDYHGEKIAITCGEGDEILKQIEPYGVNRDDVYIPDISVVHEDDISFIKNHIQQFSMFYDSLADEKSKDVMAAILNYKLTHDMRLVTEIADPWETQYFDEGLITYKDGDVFVDCGAYIGDTAVTYDKESGGRHGRIICFETDRKNIGELEKIKNKYGIDIQDVACWSKKTQLLFDEIGSGSGTILQGDKAKSNTVTVEADAIDNTLNGDRADFIKMDIEGAEYEALVGAHETIMKYHPTLMISVYHKQDDLLRLPQLIMSMNYDYKFYLRHYRSLSVQETVLYAIDAK